MLSAAFLQQSRKGGSMSQSAVQKFIASTRELFSAEADPVKRWEKMPPLLQELLVDPSIKEQSKRWPDCSQGSERAENLLFYEDPDYKFVINGLIKAPKTRTQIHDHAHNWTLYGVLDGSETIERYERVDDRSKPDYAEIRKTVNVKVGPGKIDLVPPYEIHAEESGEERTVAIIVRAEKAGGFLQGRYDPATKKYWQGYGPKQLSYELK
jgi:predicted metal-dependent enzyme (double-stranded beta helix superfamily)